MDGTCKANNDMAYGLKYRYASRETKMVVPGVYQIHDGRWLVRVKSDHKGATGRNGVKSIGIYQTRIEADAAFENYKSA